MLTALLSIPQHNRRWWIGILLLLGLSAWLRLSGYNFSLPYIDHPDEPAFYLTGLEWRGVFDNQQYLTGYPPLYIWLNIAVQLILESFGIRTIAPIIQVLRLISIMASLLTLVMIALTARRAAGELAGWVAGAAWAVSTLIIREGIYATPDPLLYLLVALAVWLAVEACYTRPHWCVWSVVAGALAILDKYYILTAIVPGVLVALMIAVRHRRQGVRYLAVQGVILLVTFAISVVGIAVLPREGAEAREAGFTNVFNLERVANNIYHAVLPLQPLVFVLVIGVGIAAYLVARRSKRAHVRLEPVLLCLLVLITVPWLAATFSEVNTTNRMKDVLPATTTASMLLGIAIGQIAELIPRRYGRLAPYSTALPLLLVFVPQLQADFDLIRNRQLPDNRVALRQWADVNLQPGTVFVDRDNHKTFNPIWGGIESAHWFDWWTGGSFFDQPLDAWRDEHAIAYAVINSGDQELLATSEAGQATAEQMLHLRDFMMPSRGGMFSVYRLWRMQHETQLCFGEHILLLGYDQSASSVAPDDTLTFQFYWKAAATPADNYSLFIHLLDAQSDVPHAQADGAPARPERPTLSWSDPTETLISQPFSLVIPTEASPGDYRLQIGLYNYQSGQRLPVTEAATGMSVGDAVLLTEIEVVR